ncbi:MAG: 16S rRNA (guanine(527)-N(7))-methyltransferase RsmG [Bacteroidota bacterium]|nr:16S rRNA (guanine(527)-N(7))-methyltransferase RsmG [Bacteroidota bacterium]
MEIIEKYFDKLSPEMSGRFAKLKGIYSEWNEKINVISRKDIDKLEERHILHSLSIAKIISFTPGTDILDIGTGGGFPGIPLAIMFPECNFVLADSIGKKITVVKAVVEALELNNVIAMNMRAEEIKRKFDFAVSRAVTDLKILHSWVRTKIKSENRNVLKNGLLYLKGGDVTEDLKYFGKSINVFEIKDMFEEEFFETKKVLYIS